MTSEIESHSSPFVVDDINIVSFPDGASVKPKRILALSLPHFESQPGRRRQKGAQNNKPIMTATQVEGSGTDIAPAMPSAEPLKLVAKLPVNVVPLLANIPTSPLGK